MLSLKKLSLLGLSCFFVSTITHNAKAQNSTTILEKDPRGQCTQITLDTWQNGIYSPHIYPLHAYIDTLGDYTLETNITHGTKNYRVYISPNKQDKLQKNRPLGSFDIPPALASKNNFGFEYNPITYGLREAVINECSIQDKDCAYD